MADTLAPITHPPVNKLENRLQIVNNPIGYICIGGGVIGFFVAKHHNKNRIGGVVVGFFTPLLITGIIYVLAEIKNKNNANGAIYDNPFNALFPPRIP